MENISENSGIRWFVESQIGGRSENQDSYDFAETSLGLLVVVCDGMGGGPGGKTASSIATQTIIDYVYAASTEVSPISVLEDAAAAANEAVLAAVEQNQSLRGMGTTCVCLLLQKNEAFIMHVGDSRCYQLRGDKVVFRTADHSYVGELVRRGSMTEEAARVSKYSNVITKAIGAGIEISPEVDTVSYKPGDRFALMTDGIWGSMPEPQLVGILSYEAEPETLVPQIAAKVDSIGLSQGGGHDNLTLALVDIPGKRHHVSKTLNDVLGEARGENRTLSNSLHGHRAAQFSLEEDSEIPDPANIPSPPSGKGKATTIYILSAALILALAVIAWFIFFSDNKKKTEKDIIRTTLKVAATDKPIQKEMTVQPEQNDKKEQSVTVSQTEDNTAIISTCNSAIKILSDLKDYKPIKSKETTKASVEGQRVEMIMAAADSLKLLAEVLESSDANKATKVREIESRLRGDASKMKKVDAKFFHSRADSNSAIDGNIAAIKALKTL